DGAGTPCAFNVVLNAQHDYEICDSSLRRVRTIPVISSNQENAKHFVINTLEHIASYKYIESIENRIPEPSLADSFTFEFGKKHTSTATSVTGTLQVQEDERFGFRFQNLGRDSLFVYLYILNPGWSIVDSMPSVAGGEGAEVSAERKPFERNYIACLPDSCKDPGIRQADEVFKFFVTRRPDSFAPLKIDSLIDSAPTRGRNNNLGQ
ncbi:hypothetical protein K458DRAFT_298180, partial [Lentithecium fluviatile CBS 122367]